MYVLQLFLLVLIGFFFIYAVQVGKVTQSSLGYYIFPLVAVAFGAIFLGERLSFSQWFAISLAVIAVVLLSLGVGEFPYISIILALTFGLYGLIKKPLTIGPLRSVFWEVVCLLPVAITWLIGVHFLGWQGILGRDGGFFASNINDKFGSYIYRSFNRFTTYFNGICNGKTKD